MDGRVGRTARIPRLSEEEAADDRERQVRLTAQRALLDLLSIAGQRVPVLGDDRQGAAVRVLTFGGLK
jgi:hypothetical protein